MHVSILAILVAFLQVLVKYPILLVQMVSVCGRLREPAGKKEEGRTGKKIQKKKCAFMSKILLSNQENSTTNIKQKLRKLSTVNHLHIIIHLSSRLNIQIKITINI